MSNEDRIKVYEDLKILFDRQIRLLEMQSAMLVGLIKGLGFDVAIDNLDDSLDTTDNLDTIDTFDENDILDEDDTLYDTLDDLVDDVKDFDSPPFRKKSSSLDRKEYVQYVSRVPRPQGE